MEGNDGSGGGGGDSSSSSQQQRWTCEACGCNTNRPSDRNCTICGTSNSGPSILRRAGAGHAAAARAGWFARGLSSAAARSRGMMNDDLGLEDEDLWESVVDGVEMAGDDPETAMESLAMEVSGMANAARSRQGLESSRQRFLEAARAFSQANRESQQRSDPQELLRRATENAASYQPRWASPAQMTGRVRGGGNGIEVGEGERRNLAHLPSGAGEGRAVRADETLPRVDAFGSFSMPSPSNASHEQRQRRVFGFRVAFDHPTAETGGNMGGCYLVGVTTSSFTAYGEQNGLQQSPFFWGIEDGGHKYEGSRYNRSAGGSRSRGVASSSSSSYAIELGAEARMNANNVLFGSREVVTVVCDFESRALTFWRDETLLGTLVTNIPRSGNLFPVAVPFNCGVTVAITGMDNDPIPLLRTFATDWRKVQQEKNDQLRQKLALERSVLVDNGKPTVRLIEALKTIFSLYSCNQGQAEQIQFLDCTAASRLWYRCGMKLAGLDELLGEKEAPWKVIFEDFLGVIETVIMEDDQHVKAVPSRNLESSCEIGDRVELVQGYEKFGDAAGGPLQPGDRGAVVEIQRGPSGERRSVRVLHNGRRWWYQPQALLSERSGLIETPGVWFLRRMLRAHGYDQTSLEPLYGEPLTSSSWCVGDVVMPKQTDDTEEVPESNNPMDSCVGRIVAEPLTSSNSLPSTGRDTATLHVEFVSKAFAEICGVSMSDSAAPLESQRVSTSMLLHSSVFHGSCVTRCAHANNSQDEDPIEGFKLPCSDLNVAIGSESSVSDKVKSEIAALARLDRAAIEAVTKECKKNSEALASLFSAGLPDAVTSAIDVAERQMKSLEIREDLSEKISAVGGLAMFIADQLFSPSPEKLGSIANDESVDDDPGNIRRGTRSSRRVSTERRQLAGRRDVRREEDHGSDSQGLVSSLQQRRTVLLSLMSRARRGNSSYLNEVMERGNAGLGRELPLGQIPPPLAPASMRGVQPFVFGPPPDMMQEGGWDEGYAGQNRTRAASSDMAEEESIPGLASAGSDHPYHFLDSILRCRGDGNGNGNRTTTTASRAGLKGAGVANSAFARHLINNCVLVDSLPWTKASIDSQTKKIQMSSAHRSSSLVRNLVDEEGTPLLQLAISFGCSVAVLGHLIVSGATVSEAEIKKAALTNQPKTLALLLQNTSFQDDMVDLNLCSPAVRRVLDEAKARQDQLDRKMRDVAGTFMVRLLRRLVRLGLSSRRHQSSRIDMCSKAISDILVGNVLLRALQKAQKTTKGSEEQEEEVDEDESTGRDIVDRSGRFSVDFTHSELSHTPQGLLGSLPQPVLAEGLLAEKNHATTLLLLIEDYLCSKDTGDAAAGLAFLSTLLTKFPQLRAWPEFDRYGMGELVSFHQHIASDRFDTLSRQLTRKTDKIVSSSDTSEHSRVRGPSSRTAKDGSICGVLCPKGHTAVLHITRHSSFRCDLCGNGVERGRPMHGCRECDWDACEDCTDKAESGLVKCTAIMEMASCCERLLSMQSSEGGEDREDCPLAQKLSRSGGKTDLKVLSKRLWRRDVHAVKELATLLDTPGMVTVHQFVNEILPALHASLVGLSSGNDGIVLGVGSGRRSKKARVVGDPYRDQDDASIDSPEERYSFCREVARLLILEPLGGKLDTSPVVTNSRSDDSHPQRNDEENDGDTDESSQDENVKQREDKNNFVHSAGGSELVRRLHQVLSLHEKVTLVPSASEKGSQNASLRGGDLQALTKPIELQLSPSTFSEAERVAPMLLRVHVEPLLPLSELEAHVLRSVRMNDLSYIAFSRRLSLDKAVVVERPTKRNGGSWQLGQVIGYDEFTGAHTIRYASRWKRGQDRRLVRLREGSSNDLSGIRYDGPEAKLALAAREYFVLLRTPGPRCEGTQLESTVAKRSSTHVECSNILQQAIGTRVESNCGPDGSWRTLTLIAFDVDASCSPEADEECFILVSDEGVLHSGVRASQIRVQGRPSLDEDMGRSAETRAAARRSREEGGVLNRAFPFLRQRSDFSRSDSGGSSDSLFAGALKRTWSALSLVESMCPVELNFPEEAKASSDAKSPTGISWKCKLGDSELHLVADPGAVEVPPRICVKFSTHEKLPGIEVSARGETTVVGALKQLQQRHDSLQDDVPLKGACKLYFSVSTRAEVSPILSEQDLRSLQLPPQKHLVSSAAEALVADTGLEGGGFPWPSETASRSRKSSDRSLDDEDGESTSGGLCDGLDERCVQCMEIITLLSKFAEDCSSPKDKDQLNSLGFANSVLSKKLSEQLENPVYVVGGALPDWCTVAPSFAPRVFSYESRRTLLERVAFGVSRSALKQQEAKVNVGKLRQRMAALRGRAVELVGEAFSGGAEDPTALQLQADELYGMEEALAARVRAAFRAVKWREHSLQVAKAAVRRDKLLSDATAVMDRYATDESVCRRRLEVRFDGESGFDAASGDEAGVTRGFYADVAEALLSCENVAGVYCATSCSYVPPTASLGKLQPMDIDEIQKETSKLPLWIPDVDTSAQVVIPTPRADKCSGLGVYPRPLPHYHPQMTDVLHRFRFIGRLFAAAVRDGFMFPLPLSSSFLKLVQHGTDASTPQDATRDVFASSRDTLLSSGDLPRPGFLGGEVYAADVHICRALDRLDTAEPPLSSFELQRKYEEIASDKNFARVALGKSYDCSFEDFFQDRTFVDPLDPTQGEDAVPLCPGGHRKIVTIFNVREWVALAKGFILHEGVISQALAFRRGVEDFFSADYLRLFTSEELQRDVCGVGDNVDSWDESAIRKLFKLDGGKGAAEALVAVAAMGGEGGAALSRRFGPSSPTIGFLVKALIEASPKQRRQFLSFVTSVPIVTPGRIEVVPMVSPNGEFLPMRDPGCLPRANTCARRLYLPKFETYESFSQVLWAVVREESKFKGFYEWRGS